MATALELKTQAFYFLPPLLDQNQAAIAMEEWDFVPSFIKQEFDDQKARNLYEAFFLGMVHMYTLRRNPIEFVIQIGGLQGTRFHIGRSSLVTHPLDLVQMLISKGNHLERKIKDNKPVEVRSPGTMFYTLVVPDPLDVVCIEAQLAGVCSQMDARDDYRIIPALTGAGKRELGQLAQKAMQRLPS